MYAGASSGTAASSGTVEFCTTMIDGIDLTSSGICVPHAGVAVQDSSIAITFEVPQQVFL